SAADVAAFLGVIAGADEKDPTAALDPVPDYRAAQDRDLQGMRIGVDPRWNDSVDRSVQMALSGAVEVFNMLGGELVEVTVPDVRRAFVDGGPACAVEAAVAHERTYPALKAHYGPVLASVIEAGRSLTAIEYQTIQLRRMELRGQFARLFQTVDLLL